MYIYDIRHVCHVTFGTIGYIRNRLYLGRNQEGRRTGDETMTRIQKNNQEIIGKMNELLSTNDINGALDKSLEYTGGTEEMNKEYNELITKIGNGRK